MKKDVIIVLVLGFFVGALSYWFNPYGTSKAFGTSIYTVLSIGGLASSFCVTFLLKLKPILVPIFMVIGLNSAVMARIVFDTIFWDPTSHNLMPFELLQFGLITSIVSLIGTFLAVFIKWFISIVR